MLKRQWKMGGCAALALSLVQLQGWAQTFNDKQNMLDQLGIKVLRPGADPKNQSTFSEENANRFAASMPDVLTMKDHTRVATAAQWPARRAEIAADFEQEIYGHIPVNVPAVNWEIVSATKGAVDGIATITRTLVGHVDNSADANIVVDIRAALTVPADLGRPVPVMIAFTGFGPRTLGRVPATNLTNASLSSAPRRAQRPGGADASAWHAIALLHGWGYAELDPTSVQPDNDHLTSGIIGLTNLGKPRTPEQWGALRAWQWGASRLIDCCEKHSEFGVDTAKMGIEGLSRYGKAALVTEAFEPRIAVGLIGSSGEGGAKLHRHIFGESVENLTGGEYYWMAGNFIRYGSADPLKTAADLPVDSHELISLCAPKPCFISYGVPAGGDPNWVDAHGSFMAAVLAGPVYELLGAKGLGTPGNYLTDQMPAPLTLIGGQLAWRQHTGGHDVTPNWPSFFEWVGQFVQSQPIHALAGQAATISAANPSPRIDPNSVKAHEQLVAKAKQGGIDLYFLGDSITRRWGCTDAVWAGNLANWKKNFFGWNAADFGWGADSIQNILWRIQNGELDGVNPKVIVILAGTNNIGTRPGGDSKVADILAGFDAMITTCHQKAPSARIILTGIFPRNDSLAVLPEIKAVNDGLEKCADAKNIFYVNVNSELADEQGNLYPGMTVDRLHPTVKGYQIWADALKPILTQLLGAPASTDHAPPPTGDPSAVGAAPAGR